MSQTHAGATGATGATGAIDGIVLAAGRSSRMGRRKAALELDGRSFLDRCLDALLAGGCRSVVVVLGGVEAARASARDGVAYARNPDPASQPIDSLRIGLAALPADSAGAAVLPVDAPAVRADTVRRLIAALRTAPGTSALVVRPVHDGTAGHPTIFARALFPELLAGELARGAETVVAAHAAARLDITVDDPGIAANVNTPADYDRLLEGE